MVGRMCIALGIETVDELDRSKMRGYLAGLSESGVKGEPLSPKTMRNYITAFNRFFEWCRQAEMAPASWANPCDGIRLPRLQDNPKRAFTQDEVLAVFRAAMLDETHERPAFTSGDGLPKMRSGLYWLMACTGLRVGIAEQLRVRHLTLIGTAPCVHVPATGTGKERKARTIAISQLDAQILREFLARHPRKPGTDDRPFDRPHPRVFYADLEAGGVSVQDGSGRWLGFHSFRRFHATQLLRMKVDPKLVQKRLGHRSLETTTKHYRDIEHEEHAGVARELGESFSAKMETSPLTGQGLIADTDNASSLPAIDNSETHAKKCGVDSGPVSLHSLPGSAAPTGGLPRSGETVSGIQNVEVEDRGLEPLARNERHSRPEDGLLVEAAVTLARILDRLSERR
jgi:integrase